VRSIDVFCVFPEAVDTVVGVGVVGRAIENGIVGYRSFDLREYSPDGRIDDMPYGGGAGMVVRVDVVARALEEVYGTPAREVRRGRRVVLTEPAGRRLTQSYVEEVASGPDVSVICGRYGGIDERVWSTLATEAVSLGDFVLSGGEIVAAALADAAIRRLHACSATPRASWESRSRPKVRSVLQPIRALPSGMERRCQACYYRAITQRSTPGARTRRWSVRGRGRPEEGRLSDPEKVH